jgi:hypothetical protein
MPCRFCLFWERLPLPRQHSTQHKCISRPFDLMRKTSSICKFVLENNKRHSLALKMPISYLYFSVFLRASHQKEASRPFEPQPPRPRLSTTRTRFAPLVRRSAPAKNAFPCRNRPPPDWIGSFCWGFPSAGYGDAQPNAQLPEKRKRPRSAIRNG